ncbi:hypothetical protein O181_025749 [Austropuccinia psidii MF-1]|uniref:Uncharacterized protein n=1 Tax=Austropuccinia psidii MF-1 TaxID=1389203 RepID=A0A9Q3CL69_9BASI|nr:hypothetical protein [Austropuccinia psidii MF-1]
MGPEVLMAIFGTNEIGGQNWLRWVHLWFRTHLASLDLGHKGPKGTTAYGPWAVDYGPQAIGGLNGPKTHTQRGGAKRQEAPGSPEGPPRPRKGVLAWGLVRC